MNLKPMSLGNNTKNTPSNEGIQAYVKPPTEDDCPKLYIIDGSKSTRFTMSIFRNTYVQSALTNMQDHSVMGGQSTDTFSKIIGRIDQYKDSDSILTRDLLIYGCICESFSKAGIPLEVITQHTDILTEFIKESLCYYDYSTQDIKFDLSNLLTLIQIKKEKCDYESLFVKRFILPGESTSKGLLCKGIIGISDGFVYIQPSLCDVYKIDCPKFLAPISDHRILSDAANSLLWILLEHLHFHGNEVFETKNEDIKFKVRTSMLNGASFTSPTNLRIEMRLDTIESITFKKYL